MSAEDIDKVMTHGLGTRYAFIGPFMTAHLNAEGREEKVMDVMGVSERVK